MSLSTLIQIILAIPKAIAFIQELQKVLKKKKDDQLDKQKEKDLDQLQKSKKQDEIKDSFRKYIDGN